MRIFSLSILLLLSACSWSDYKLMVPDEIAQQQERARESRADAITPDEYRNDTAPQRAMQPVHLDVRPANEYAPQNAPVPAGTIARPLYPAQSVHQPRTYQPQLPPPSGVKVNNNVEVFPMDEWTLPNRFRR